MKTKLLAVILCTTCMAMTGCANHIRNGIVHLENEQYKEAVASFEEQVEKGKDLDQAYHGLFLAYYGLGEYQTALDMCAEGVSAGMTKTDTVYCMEGNCYLELAQYDEAILAYEAGLSLARVSEENQKEMMFNRVAASEYAGDWERAKEYATLYLKLYPDDEDMQKEAKFLQTR